MSGNRGTPAISKRLSPLPPPNTEAAVAQLSVEGLVPEAIADKLGLTEAYVQKALRAAFPETLCQADSPGRAFQSQNSRMVEPKIRPISEVVGLFGLRPHAVVDPDLRGSSKG
jgi:hypothetical protein